MSPAVMPFSYEESFMKSHSSGIASSLMRSDMKMNPPVRHPMTRGFESA